MILLKANSELKKVFGRMLNTMGVNVVWTGNFVVLNNFLILSGNVRSLIFNFDNGKILTNVIELPDKEEDMEPVADNEVVTNVLNMTLYAFGKWGVIKGLKVDKDYSQLNGLFYAILKDMKITPGFQDNYFRFYRNNIQMTYEEVVEAALEEGRRKAQEAPEEKEQEAPEEKGMGLWHNIRWSVEKATFIKSEIKAAERNTARPGNNFYISGYQCPGCGRKLYMAVYPQGREFPVETEEGKVYLARSYTCGNCNLFYTPKPGRLLREGQSYAMKFGGDKEAYEDYQELLGSKAEHTSNCNFNEFESQRGKHTLPAIEEACAELEEKSEEELQAIAEQIDDGFYPPLKAEPYLEKIEELLEKRRREKEEKKSGKKKEEAVQSSDKTASGQETSVPEGKNVSSRHPEKEEAPSGSSKEKSEDSSARAQEEPGKEPQASDSPKEEQKEQDSRKSADHTAAGEEKSESASGQEAVLAKGNSGKKSLFREKESVLKFRKQQEEKKEPKEEEVNFRERYKARMRTLEKMSLFQLKTLRSQIQSDERLDWIEKEKFTKQIKQEIFRKEEEELRRKAAENMDKPYGMVKRVMEEISQGEIPEPVKKELLSALDEVKKQRGQEEAKKLIALVPEHMSRSQYQTFKEKLDRFQDADISTYQEVLEGKRRLTEKREISAMLSRAEKSDRNGLMRMLKKLKEDGFSGEQAEPAIEFIEKKVRAIDEKVIDKICPNIMRMSFDEAAEAYEKIEGGAFLPELKTNTLEMIDRRLTKIKMDECELLVEKLREELKGKVRDTERLHFYEVRKVMNGDWGPREAELVARAMNTYGSERDRYEFPILICDSSPRKNGKEGFILTPDHIFYNSVFSSEMIPVRSIRGIEGMTGLLNRGLYLDRSNGVRTKIPGGIAPKDLKALGDVLGKFVSYLKEKPESRSIAYLAKEKHEVKCCYRCGYNYRKGNVCPKCGYQSNQ